MSKSLRPVRNALTSAGTAPEVFEVHESARTAAEAARVLGCAIDQIHKINSLQVRECQPGS